MMKNNRKGIKMKEYFYLTKRIKGMSLNFILSKDLDGNYGKEYYLPYWLICLLGIKHVSHS